MAKADSNDLRRKLLEAYDRDEGSLRELAERFGVSSPYAWKISAQRTRTGQVERVEQRHGPESKVTGAVEQQLRRWGRQQPDLTLAGGVGGGAGRDRSGPAGVSGREWGDHGNDAPLGTGAVGRACAGGDSGGTLEHAYAVGSLDEPGTAGQHDGGIAHRRRGVPGLSARGL